MKQQTKVFVIGGGPAGMSAALAAYESIGERKEMTVSFDVLQNPCKSSEVITLTPTFSGTKISINAPPLMKFDTPHL